MILKVAMSRVQGSGESSSGREGIVREREGEDCMGPWRMGREESRINFNKTSSLSLHQEVGRF